MKYFPATLFLNAYFILTYCNSKFSVLDKHICQVNAKSLNSVLTDFVSNDFVKTNYTSDASHTQANLAVLSVPKENSYSLKESRIIFNGLIF
jgi:hypothetical protein